MRTILLLTLSCLFLTLPAQAWPPPNWRSAPERAVPERAAPGDDALGEVNAWRAQRGLRPYLPDPALNAAARACAEQRAARLCQGHLPEGDFRYLPPGATATSAGCAAWEPSAGWGSCCTDGNYTYAGAAWRLGRDGLRYMDLFVR